MIVIGGSLGGFAALGRVLSRLPSDFSLPIAVVLHRHRDSDELLLPALRRACPLPVSEVVDKEPVAFGHVYLCPADYHLMLDGSVFMLSTDDLVSYARPSVDVLFESAAEWRGDKVSAVILSGAGSDGAVGARRVEDRGGRVFVQDPATAEGPWMPLAATAATRHAAVLSLEEIALRLAALGR